MGGKGILGQGNDLSKGSVEECREGLANRLVCLECRIIAAYDKTEKHQRDSKCRGTLLV